MRAADLARLQEIDLALDARRASVEDAEGRLGDSEDVAAARAVVEQRTTELHAAEGTQKDVELEAETLKGKIGPAEAKLYSGSIKNPKELGDLQADIEQLKRQLSTVEDRQLEAINGAEEAQSALRAAQAELDALEAAWREEQAEMQERIARVGAEIAEYEAARDERAATIDPDLLKRYDRIRFAHQGRGVAKLDRNLCTGCRISLPVNTVNKARAGNALIQCPNCERILYS